MCVRGDGDLDQGGSSGGGEIKLDSWYYLVVKPTVFTFGLDVGFREKKKIDPTVFDSNNGKNGVATS